LLIFIYLIFVKTFNSLDQNLKFFLAETSVGVVTSEGLV